MDRAVSQKVRTLALQVADDLDYELVDLTLSGGGKRSMLRVFIDKEGGVTLTDCETFSRQFEALLDVEDPIHGSYNLEVSSPGLDRPLKEIDDFRKNIGKLARIITKEKIGNQSFFIGRLMEVDDNVIKLFVLDGDREVDIPFDNVSKAKLEIELK